MVDLPAPKKWAINIPTLSLTIRSQDESALPRPHQHPYSAHLSSFLSLTFRKCSPFHFTPWQTRRRSQMLSRLMSSCLDHLSVYVVRAPFADFLVVHVFAVVVEFSVGAISLPDAGFPFIFK